jgi:hypothetical protein
MLERQGLILAPWQPRSGGPREERPCRDRTTSYRLILDRQTRQQLGVVRDRSRRTWRLFRWWTRTVWEVLETEDESLLASLHGPWALVKPWEVFDAEERLVCSIQAGSIFDSAGVARVRQLKTAHPVRQSFFSSADEELAWFRPMAEGLELVFLPVVHDDPYAKMSLLAATLAADPR